MSVTQEVHSRPYTTHVVWRCEAPRAWLQPILIREAFAGRDVQSAPF